MVFCCDLVDAMDADFHRVFHGRDIPAFVVEQLQSRIQRYRLTATGGARGEHHAVGFLDRFVKYFLLLGIETQLLDAQLGGGGVKDTQYDFFAEQRGAGAYPEVDALVPGKIQLDTAVLGHALLGDIQPGHDLEA